MPRERALFCTTCGTLKVTAGNGAPKCKQCSNRWKREQYARSNERRRQLLRGHVGRRYGVTLEKLELLCIKQGGRCAICLRSWYDCRRPKLGRHETSFLQHLNVDHDHKTGTVRGLLCHGCNAAIGQLDDDPGRVMAAMRYLLNHTTENASVDVR